MVKAYTEEQRLNALSALDSGNSRRAVSSALGIGTATLARWVAQRRASGQVGPAPRGARPLLTEGQCAQLVELVKQNPNASLAELASAVATSCGVKLSIHAVSDYLHAAGFHKETPATVAEEPAPPPVGTRYQDRHRRDPKDGRYPSSLTDAEFAVLEPLLARQDRRGRPPKYERRVMLDAVFYVVRTGCQWRSLPHDFPPWGPVWATFRRWRNSGLLDAMYEALFVQWRKQADRKAEPTAGIIDSQSVKTTEKGGLAATTAERRSKGASGISSWIH